MYIDPNLKLPNHPDGEQCKKEALIIEQRKLKLKSENVKVDLESTKITDSSFSRLYNLVLEWFSTK